MPAGSSREGGGFVALLIAIFLTQRPVRGLHGQDRDPALSKMLASLQQPVPSDNHD
jgi:hypothetical protein